MRWNYGSLCGTNRMKGSLLKSLNKARMQRKPAALITRILDGTQTLFVENRVSTGPELDLSLIHI